MQTVSTLMMLIQKRERKEATTWRQCVCVCVCYNGNSRCKCSVSLSKWQYPSVLAPVVDPITREKRRRCTIKSTNNNNSPVTTTKRSPEDVVLKKCWSQQRQLVSITRVALMKAESGREKEEAVKNEEAEQLKTANWRSVSESRQRQKECDEKCAVSWIALMSVSVLQWQLSEMASCLLFSTKQDHKISEHSSLVSSLAAKTATAAGKTCSLLGNRDSATLLSWFGSTLLLLILFQFVTMMHSHTQNTNISDKEVVRATNHFTTQQLIS